MSDVEIVKVDEPSVPQVPAFEWAGAAVDIEQTPHLCRKFTDDGFVIHTIQIVTHPLSQKQLMYVLAVRPQVEAPAPAIVSQ